MTEPAREVATVDLHDDERPDGDLTMDDLARRYGVGPVRSVHEMASPDLFGSDEEADEFVAATFDSRRRDVA